MNIPLLLKLGDTAAEDLNLCHSEALTLSDIENRLRRCKPGTKNYKKWEDRHIEVSQRLSMHKSAIRMFIYLSQEVLRGLPPEVQAKG